MSESNKIVAAICGAWSEKGPVENDNDAYEFPGGYHDTELQRWVHRWKWTVTAHYADGTITRHILSPCIQDDTRFNRHAADTVYAMLMASLSMLGLDLTSENGLHGRACHANRRDRAYEASFAYWAVDDTSRHLVENGYYPLS